MKHSKLNKSKLINQHIFQNENIYEQFYLLPSVFILFIFVCVFQKQKIENLESVILNFFYNDSGTSTLYQTNQFHFEKLQTEGKDENFDT
jgi:hypothetical protein